MLDPPAPFITEDADVGPTQILHLTAADRDDLLLEEIVFAFRMTFGLGLLHRGNKHGFAVLTTKNSFSVCPFSQKKVVAQ
jgi:hypothetical protein